jgi:hypothetical protein
MAVAEPWSMQVSEVCVVNLTVEQSAAYVITMPGKSAALYIVSLSPRSLYCNGPSEHWMYKNCKRIN